MVSVGPRHRKVLLSAKYVSDPGFKKYQPRCVYDGCCSYLANDKELRIDGVEDMDNLIIQKKAAITA